RPGRIVAAGMVRSGAGEGSRGLGAAQRRGGWEMSAWTVLLLAGLLEVAWAVGLKYTDGFTRLAPSLATLAAMVASMWLLALAVRALPIGTAYAVWVGIGATGAAVAGILLFGEPVTAARVGFLVLLIVAIVGLRATEGAAGR